MRNSLAKANKLDKELQAVKRQLKRQGGEGGFTDTVQQLRKELNESQQQLHATHTLSQLTLHIKAHTQYSLG